MGTWDFGPFDNDAAADFAGELDDAAPDERAALVRAALDRAAATVGYLESDDGEPAVAAAALVAAQCPGGEPVDPAYGPKEPIPGIGRALVEPALRALDRVLGAESELAELWDDSGEGPRWRERLGRLRAALGPWGGDPG
ncbi:DUF4259 domain-containing protein [Kitasatospora azatica]|uniref:DUF4259 domain-containing protein n=1 Tax=Kitasatospora azatica TaxID=58347 RepID=UPI00055B2035|nr:DUF4259 domain-containing protein [Kitasatospora azatica]